MISRIFNTDLWLQPADAHVQVRRRLRGRHALPRRARLAAGQVSRLLSRQLLVRSVSRVARVPGETARRRARGSGVQRAVGGTSGRRGYSEPRACQPELRTTRLVARHAFR